MNIMIDSLYVITSGLLIPCVAYLLYLLVQSLLSAGHTVGIRRKEQTLATQLSDWVHSLVPGSAWQFPDSLVHYRAAPIVKQLLHSPSAHHANYLISEHEVNLECQLAKLSNQAKLGPIVGLMGTLIPMGPALQGLANGDIAQLATQMQVAFTTTVIGLIVGAIGFVLFQIERRAVARELALLDLLNALLEERQHHESD